ncbi:type II secretion system F family protein [Xylocopilactobacillus apicola]|uniref:Type II secretion system F family protein n=1 Tax=Xylocopilactobacillus apicola TaxID=2932184 RepID=A0AAU9D1E4_9LACO|nr:type II secretion system F family protein [Xylocopilactobacillus apicola]BDR58536.1 type II secretion system F family protein [Xylocopilactobacillus apicola]BDR58558.1 type II secretion system F family protein [Xylocopilactobacillus apicola]
MAKNKLARKDQAIIMIHLGEMMKNGFSIIQAFNFLETVYPKYQKRIQKLTNRLHNGEVLTTALTELGIAQNIIDQLEISYAHGNLQESFITFGKMLQYRNAQTKKILQLLTYPIFLLAMLAALQLGLKAAGFQAITGSSENKMDQLINISFFLVIGLTLSGLIFYLIVSLRPVTKQVQIFRKVPLIGKTILCYYHYLIMFDLTLFVQNGFSINQMIAICHSRPKKSYLFQISQQIEKEIISGTNLIAIVRKYTYFPTELEQLLGRGLETENLKIEFSALTKIIYERLLAGIERIINKIQPLMFLFVGVCVVIVYLNIMLPIFQMMKGI